MRQKVDDCLDKINLSASHLLALVNDVLDMNKLESGKETIESVSFDLTHLMDDCSIPLSMRRLRRWALPTVRTAVS